MFLQIATKRVTIICRIFLGRGFDQEIFQEKDEANVCSYNTKFDGEVKRQMCWDTDHPHIYHPRANCGHVTIGKTEHP